MYREYQQLYNRKLLLADETNASDATIRLRATSKLKTL